MRFETHATKKLAYIFPLKIGVLRVAVGPRGSIITHVRAANLSGKRRNGVAADDVRLTALSLADLNQGGRVHTALLPNAVTCTQTNADCCTLGNLGSR